MPQEPLFFMIVMTGATGFLGSHLLRALLADGEEICVLKRPSSNLARIDATKVRLLDIGTHDVERLFASGAVQTILHCATNYGRASVDQSELVEANILLPLKLLHLGQKHGLKRFVNTDTMLDKRINAYSLSKSQFVQWLRASAPVLRCTNVSLEHFYGPGDDPSKFCTQIVRTLLAGDSEIALSPGEQKRWFVYIDDVVAAFRAILRSGSDNTRGFEDFQVGSETAVSIRRFVELAKLLTGNEKTALRFGALPYRENEVMDPALDLTALHALGWRQRISLEEGLNRTVDGERRNIG